MRLCGSVKFDLILPPRLCTRWLRVFATGLFPSGAGGVTGSEFALVFRALQRGTGLRAGFDFGARFGQLRLALLPPLDFCGDRESVLERGAVGVLGFAQQLLDFQIQFPHHLPGTGVADRGVFTGAGQHLGPVDGHGDPADLEHAALRGQFEDLGEAAREQLAVNAAEGADRVVIGMRVRAEQPDRDVLVSGALDFPAGEEARGVAVDKQAEHQARRILRIAGAALVDPRPVQVEFADGVHDEVDKMIGRHPLAQVRRQQQRRVVVNVDEAGGHPLSTRNVAQSWTESPTGC